MDRTHVTVPSRQGTRSLTARIISRSVIGPQQNPGHLPPPPSATPYPHASIHANHFPASRWSWRNHSYAHPPLPGTSSSAGHLPAASGVSPPHLPPSHGYEHFSWHGRYPTRSFYPRGYRRGPRLLPLVLVGTVVFFATRSYYRHPPHSYDGQRDWFPSDHEPACNCPLHPERHAYGVWASRHGLRRAESESGPQQGVKPESQGREAVASEDPKPSMTRLEARLKAREQEWSSRWDRAMQEQRERQGPPEKWV